MANSQPPPNAYPLMAARVGLAEFSSMAKISCPRSENFRLFTWVRSAISEMSAPAINAFSPVPVIIKPLIPGSSYRFLEFFHGLYIQGIHFGGSVNGQPGNALLPDQTNILEGCHSIVVRKTKIRGKLMMFTKFSSLKAI